MASRSQSGPTNLSLPSISEESIHVDRCLQSEVHKKTQRQHKPYLQEKRSATNTEGPSYSSKDREVERLKEQVVMLRREAERNEELLRRNDEELLHQRGPSPMPSHSRGDKHVVGDRHRKRDKRQFPYRKRMASPPPPFHRRNKRIKQDREKLKGPVPQHSMFPNPRDPVKP
ncbi:hypothetical protein CMV_028740 [Castanea mollissima]|uniref:Uncharacterized protein n=1 Tax=Castanea mollissima TaxID=60419 RepID=A0A8J4Q7Q7_9ROSI|nr:hypothetical protein CMV_028740 [Castanea mollissima]